MIFKQIIKYVILMNIFIYINKVDDENRNIIFYNLGIKNKDTYTLSLKNITNIPPIYIIISKINCYFTNESDNIQVKYYFKLLDQNYNQIKPSDISLLYNLHLFCEMYLYITQDKIYSIVNIYKNKLYYCIEYTKNNEKAKFGIKIFKTNEMTEEIQYDEILYSSDELIYQNKNVFNQSKNYNNNKFNIQFLYNKYNDIIANLKKTKKNNMCLKCSFLQPPLFSLKRNIANVKGRWYFKNIYQTYFCFCIGESCINLQIFNMYNFQSCKYFFYLTIIDKNRYLYSKTHYLLSDFFNENIESVDALPIFNTMINNNFNAHYITMSTNIYKEFCLNDTNCLDKMQIIYGIKKINGDILEKYLELILRLKAVITAEKYESIDNIFYNIEYITYIFLGHGVTYIKSFLYTDYLHPNRYNKILLPNTKLFIDLALKAGWKNENIIKIGYPKWDQYKIYNSTNNLKKNAQTIFLMFTWRKVKKGKNISNLYFNNICNILYNYELNEVLKKNNVKLFFCYHHTLKITKKIIGNNNIRIINQNEISTLIKNSSLIITDFSSILFDAIVQKKPLILFLPDGLDYNLEDIYSKQYYETIKKIKNGEIYLDEIYLDVNEVINKTIYYIENNFILEESRMKFYKRFKLKNRDNTRKFIRYIRMLK